MSPLAPAPVSVLRAASDPSAGPGGQDGAWAGDDERADGAGARGFIVRTCGYLPVSDAEWTQRSTRLPSGPGPAPPRSNATDLARDLDALLRDGFGYWLAGLIDGEGCFTITPNRPGFICRSTVSLRADDEPVLREIVSRTGIGMVVPRPVSRRDGARRCPQTIWRVQKKAECGTLVAILDTFPLRAKKAADYAIWREAVAIMAAMQPVHAKYWSRRAQDWQRVAELKERLADGRRFDEEGL